MPEPRPTAAPPAEPRHMRVLARACAGAVLALALATAACLPTALATTPKGKVAKRKEAQQQAALLTAAPQLTYHQNATDTAAVKAGKQADVERAKANAYRVEQDVAAQRILSLQATIDQDVADEAQLRSELVARLVTQYQQGANSGLALVAASGSLSEALDRADALDQLSQEDGDLAARHAASVARLQEAQDALELVRDHKGELATAVDTHADALDAQLGAAREAHESELLDVDTSGKLATAGTFRIFGGDQAGAQALMLPLGGQVGGTYSGGTRTPARPASDLEINTILSDPRIDIYPAGRIDIATRQIDGRVIDALELLAGHFQTVHVTMLKSGHSIMTASGNVSEHSFGCAVDIGALTGIRIQPSTQGPGSITEQGVLFLSALTGDLAPHQVISLYSYGGPSLGMADHYDHIHLGYHC